MATYDTTMPEKTEITGGYSDDRNLRATAFSGTGFNPDNHMHMVGSNAPRWAIWMQMARDQKDFSEADRLRELAVGHGYVVAMTKDSVTLTYPFDPPFSTFADGTCCPTPQIKVA